MVSMNYLLYENSKLKLYAPHHKRKDSMVDKIDPFEGILIDKEEKYRQEAMKMTVDAFNEGYQLGLLHAESIYGKGADENQS